MADPVQFVGGHAGRDVLADLSQGVGGELPATRIRSIVSASLTSGSPVRVLRPTYSGRAMLAGTLPRWGKPARVEHSRHVLRV